MKTLQILIIKIDYLWYLVRDSRLFSDKEHKKTAQIMIWTVRFVKNGARDGS